MKFEELNLDNRIIEAIQAMRFDECTPIQEQTIPPLLEGRDLIGVAQTGTGKTAAYLLPILNRLCSGNYRSDAINCIIMAPTRELAQQIDQAMEAFSYFVPFSSVAVYGGNDGVRYEQELKGMQLGADVIIATPGRFISHLQLGNVDLSHVSFFVLDEADRMLDMGFIDDIMKIVSYLPKQRQTLLFSATMPSEIQTLAKNILHNPVEVKIAISKPAEGIDQSAFICYEAQKIGILKDLFKKQPPHRVIIFSSSKMKVKELSLSLRRQGINVSEMHSDLDQAQRDEVMRNFRNNKIDVLVATDILSRGIDIDDIELVVNYDVPRDVEDYVHRIGRTARAGSKGSAITLVNEKDQSFFSKIEKTLEKDIRKNPLPEGMSEGPAYDKNAKHAYNGSHHHSPHRNNKPRQGQPTQNGARSGKNFHHSKPSGKGGNHNDNSRPHAPKPKKV